MFTASFQIVKDCPLTLWNAAGALSSLGRHKEAIPIYVWLLKAKTSVNKDPCWESKKWSDALKTDCVYRLGLCFEYLDKRETAEHCYIQYLTLVATGVKGTYSIDDVLSRVHRLGGEAGPEEKTRDLQNAIKSTLMAVEPNSTKDRASGDLLRLDSSDLVPELLVASKR